MLLRLRGALLACTTAVFALQGCGGSDDSSAVTGDEEDAIPAAAKTLWDQSPVCSEILKRHQIVRSIDLKDGNIRWNCADVPGVTSLDGQACRTAQDDLRKKEKAGTAKQADYDKVNNTCQGFGQEYCEYAAISSGKMVKKLSDVAPNAPISCLFTSVWQDAYGSKQSTEVAKLATSLGAKENLGAAVVPTAAAMQVGFNSRGAATALITDCRTNAQADKAKDLLNEERQAACWLASVATTDATKQGKLKTACRGRNLADEARWSKVKALGVDVAAAGTPAYESERELASCLASARSGGVTFRNSDNIICGRVTRAAEECGCDYAALPEAPLVGFTFAGWTNDALPQGCRYAKISGAEFKNLVVCDLSVQERQDLEIDDTYSVDLQAMCHDKFSREIVMKAPIRAVEKKGTCKTDTPFCKAYAGQ